MQETLEQKKARLRALRIEKETADAAIHKHTKQMQLRVKPAEAQRRIDLEVGILAAKLHLAVDGPDVEPHPVLKEAMRRAAIAAGVDTPF